MDIPDNAEERSNTVYNLTDSFLTELRNRLGDLIVADLGVIIYRVAGAMRSSLPFPDAAQYIGNMVMLSERVLTELAETEGVVLAEHYHDMPDRDEIVKDLNEGLEGDTIPEDWLNEGEEE